jgi:light-regulated signal transduction histidine kinase (bacteriophytochrome)
VTAGAVRHLERQLEEQAVVLTTTIGEVAEGEKREQVLHEFNEILEARVLERTASLARVNAALIERTASLAAVVQELKASAAGLASSNEELAAFAYSVSHDLRAPLRHIDGFSKALLEDHGPALEPQAVQYIETVREAAQRMGRLIDDLLSLSRVTRGTMSRRKVDLTAVAETAAANLARLEPDRKVHWLISEGLMAYGDPGLLAVIVTNLFANAWKFSAGRARARIEFTSTTGDDGTTVFLVRDDGVGFDMQYATQLFTPFHRMHHAAEFDGLGIGLATVHRVISRHLGRIWAESSPGNGASFFFTLPCAAGDGA